METIRADDLSDSYMTINLDKCFLEFDVFNGPLTLDLEETVDLLYKIKPMIRALVHERLDRDLDSKLGRSK